MKLADNVYQFLFTTLFLVLLFTSCNTQETIQPQDTPEEQLDKNLVKDGAGYRKAMDTRNAGDGVEFSIKEIKREGKFLKVHVYGGCNEASFKFIWDGTIAQSYPMQVGLVLVHEQASEICPAVMDHFPVLDLSQLLGEHVRLEDYIFHVYNGSRQQDASLNPNGISSIKTNN